MTFDYEVKHNGIYYPAGTDVPIEETNGGGKDAPAALVSGKVDDALEKPEITLATYEKPRKYLEDDLNVSIQQLRKLAKENGLKITNRDKSDDIRDMLRAL